MILFLLFTLVQCRQLIRPPGDATSDASFTRGEAHKVGASGAVESVKEAESITNDYVESTAAVEPYVKKALREAEIRVELANKDKESALEALEAGRIASKYVIDWSSKYAAAQVDEKLGPVLQKLQEWKMAVLHDPSAESKKAAYKAAAPFEKAMMITEKRVNEYMQRAQALNSKAALLRGAAQGTASAAVTKQADAVDFEGAQKDMMNAHQMTYQADNFALQALAMQDQAKLLEVNIPLYKDAAANARATTAHRYDPVHVPAPLPSPNAFNPPPPTTDII